MRAPDPLIDIHCHILPSIDDGADSWDEALAMADLAAGDGITTIVATPHQLGAYAKNTPSRIRERVRQLQDQLKQRNYSLTILAGADIRIEDDLLDQLDRGNLVSLADQGRHLLLEFPHRIAIPLESLTEELSSRNIQPILTHPERNRQLLRDWNRIEQLVELGCLMQITAGALTGSFGADTRAFAEWLVHERLVHFIATDAHGSKSRRPLLNRAFHRVAELVDISYAVEVCCENPYRAIKGETIPIIERRNQKYRFASWFRWRRAA